LSALVTGAGGFVGSAVVRALLARGEAVRAMVRQPSANLAGLDCEIVTADICDADAVRAALADSTSLYHVAADYRLWARDPGEIERTNVSGTRTVMTTALAAGVKRIVYTSSVATLALTDNGVPADETAPLDATHAIGAYKRSKVAAERVVEDLVVRRGLPAVIVNPSTPIGPCDSRPTPTGRVIVEAARGRMPAFVDTGLNLVHVDDVAAGHLLAHDRGRIGERYILGGQDATLQAMLAAIAKRAGRRAPTLSLPRGPLFPLAWAAEAVAQFTGREPMLTADGLRLAKYRMFFTHEKASRELGYTARPYEDAIDDALAWFGAHGYLK
jgi:dihydroflavonol-4-reductase